MDLCYHLAFSHFLGIGPVKFNALKNHFGSAKKAYLADKNDLEEVIGVHLTEKFLDFRSKFDPDKKLEELKRKEIRVLCWDDKNYPQSLKNISDPPICLYIKGDMKILTGSVSNSIIFAIVGTRQPTSYGLQVAKKFSYELAALGFSIVSGMAYGIDTIAHRACLDAEGKTIVVLGCGVDVVYPAANVYLYQQILQRGGAIVSEFPPGQFVLKGLFIARNRIISGLSKGVMIVEGLKDSGSLITARYAAEQGKDVFAPPSPITSIMAAAPNMLLKQGARLVTSVEDILEEFDMKITPKRKEDFLEKLAPDEKCVFSLLAEKPHSADEIALTLNKTANEILNILSLMEIKGLIEKNKENHYQLAYQTGPKYTS